MAEYIVSNNNTALFTVQPAIAPNGTLTYTPAVGRLRRGDRHGAGS